MTALAIILGVALLVSEIRRRIERGQRSAALRAANAALADHERHHVAVVSDLYARLLVAQERAGRASR